MQGTKSKTESGLEPKIEYDIDFIRLDAKQGALNWSWTERAVIEDYVARTSRYKSNPIRNSLMHQNKEGVREAPTRWTKKRLLVRPKVAGELNHFATAELYYNNKDPVLNSKGGTKTLQLNAVKPSTDSHGYPGGKL